MNVWLFENLGQRCCVVGGYVAKLERGENRWPSAHNRSAFRAVLGAATDAELGFFIIQGHAKDGADEQRAALTVPACGCGLVVGRWTPREARMLREALRMTVRAFGEHLGMTTNTVSLWENARAVTPLRLATQSVLDRALKMADADARGRFAVLLGASGHDPGTATAGPTPLHAVG
ncbi:hypothetical protein GCM10009687_63320 [Asanoa iriomotensis]|uniref:Helix-turn-helix protein n=1 Tax=Asanoa iriomotensis TaxID=234613 RepID=A0ABQ4C4D6_9ACTN|nr:hypothetical protein Air01nite_37220 [Asanoa iriomotensis]